MSANRGARWLLYGANGYTGALIAEEAVRRGLRPILAGRRAEAVRPLAARLGLEVRVFSLDSVEEIARGLEGVGAVCLAAGPFARTSAPMVQACLATRTHYTDITGEVPIFEACHRLDVEAKAAGIALLPGVGFDVVPTDCLAASLAARLPTARRLALAFAVEGGPSGGTARTMIEGLPEGGLVRRGGRLVRVPAAHATRWVPFHDRSRHAVAFPWGDVSTAFYSTGIGDIEVYMAAPRIAARALGATRHLTGLLGSRPAQRALRGLVQLAIRDPDAQANRAASCQVWGRVEDDAGGGLEGTLEGPGTYPLTAQTAVDATERCARGEAPAGALTPSMAFGADYVERFEGVRMHLEA